MTVSTERGPYLTGSRALELERQIAAAEARCQARIDEMNRELRELRRQQTEMLRAQAAAFLEVLRGATPVPHDERTR